MIGGRPSKSWIIPAIVLLAFSQSSSASAQGTVGSFPYPKWFYGPRDSTPDSLVFRKFGFEGMARNLFVLTCSKDPRSPAKMELIPPKAMEARLSGLASAQLTKTSIQIYRTQTGSADAKLFESEGTYDKIAAFVELPERSLLEFLQLFQNEKILIRWDAPKFEYLLWASAVHADQFAKTFSQQLREANYEELSFQDVYIRCNGLWGR